MVTGHQDRANSARPEIGKDPAQRIRPFREANLDLLVVGCHARVRQPGIRGGANGDVNRLVRPSRDRDASADGVPRHDVSPQAPLPQPGDGRRRGHIQSRRFGPGRLTAVQQSQPIRACLEDLRATIGAQKELPGSARAGRQPTIDVCSLRIRDDRQITSEIAQLLDK